jgi:predicted AlkP superfamily pyrophosphatase or phosphodiesterase
MAAIACCLVAFACQSPPADQAASGTGEPVAEATPAPPPGTPRLVLMIVIDQFGSDSFERIEPFFTAGYRRLIDSGVVFSRGVHQHALTETGPGHATISTGQFPRDHGIVTNWFVEPGLPELIWAGDDDEYNKSPHRLMVPAVGDWIKERYPTAKVFTASAKARAAVMLGGKHANAAFWWEEEDGLLESSTYYDVPEWFESFNNQRLAARFYGKVWNPLPLSAEDLQHLQVEPLDLGPLRPSFPHVFGGLRPAPVETFYDDMWGSPWLDMHLAQLAHTILEEEQLGADDVPDLLALSFSVSDIIGHRFGPHSREYVDILLRQDKLVGEILDHIDSQVGLEQTLVVLTSDHGVVTAPEILQRWGKPGARVDWETIHCVQQATDDLAEKHGVEEWLIAGTFLAPGLSEFTGLSELELEQATARSLEECPAVEKVWTDSELTSSEAQQRPTDENDERWLFANSYYPGRSAEFQIRYREYFMPSRGSLTTHGTSYLYDRQVPIVFMMPGKAPARHDSSIATVDIAPTIAGLLGVPLPDGVDGENRVPHFSSSPVD